MTRVEKLARVVEAQLPVFVVVVVGRWLVGPLTRRLGQLGGWYGRVVDRGVRLALVAALVATAMAAMAELAGPANSHSTTHICRPTTNARLIALSVAAALVGIASTSRASVLAMVMATLMSVSGRSPAAPCVAIASLVGATSAFARFGIGIAALLYAAKCRADDADDADVSVFAGALVAGGVNITALWVAMGVETLNLLRRAVKPTKRP